MEVTATWVICENPEGEMKPFSDVVGQQRAFPDEFIDENNFIYRRSFVGGWFRYTIPYDGSFAATVSRVERGMARAEAMVDGDV